ncbi:hypothetical protein [Burkholderia sp. Z1]|uniref:hypothetical protein n=1 Tax=Burkholderia sp. Z1 TaxID=2759039 RepID=UPI0018675105|nr:hypothetical protein [Burkholderia sp. Z1]
MNLPFPGERPTVGYLALSQLLSIEASAVDQAAELVKCEQVGRAVLLLFQFGGADHFFHQPQCSAHMNDFQHKPLLYRKRSIFLEIGCARQVVQFIPCQALELTGRCMHAACGNAITGP